MSDMLAPPLTAPAMAALPLEIDSAYPPSGPIVAPAPVAAVVPDPQQPQQQETASETLYIQNLNEKIKIPVLKASLRGLFKSYGEVLDVVAHSNLRMRGQAFISFENVEIAKKALKEVRGFPLYSKPMVRLFVLLYSARANLAVANLVCEDTVRCYREEA